MKQKHILSSLMLLFCTFLSAETYNGTCGENLTWSLDTETGVLTISGTGAMSDYDIFSGDNSVYAPWYEYGYRSFIKKVEIAEGVTHIGNYAFYYCTDLTSITIPGSVTSIGYGVFYDCGSLTSIKVDDNNTAYCDINGVLFDKTITTLIQYPVGKTDNSYSIPESVTSIGDDTFNGCAELTSVTIPDGVISIGGNAFTSCSGLTAITIPNSVTNIEYGAFTLCSGLTCIIVESGNTKYDSRNNCNAIIETETNTLITGCQNTIIPNSVTSIGARAFYGCEGLTSIEIPNSVKSIGEYAFSFCTVLTSLEIPNSVTNIGFEAFYDIPNIVYNGSATGSPWGAKCVNGDIEGFLIYSDASRTKLIACSTSASGEIIIPNTVTTIGEDAFRNCSSMTSIEIPNSVTSIDYSAFYGCSSLTSINIPNGVTSIGHNAFTNCTGLTSVTIPESVQTIGAFPFSNCSNLTSVIWNAVSCTIYDDGQYVYPPFQGCGNIKTFTIGDNVQYLPGGLCYGLPITSIVIPDKVTNIGANAFNSCIGLTSVTIPNSVTSIGNSAFEDCIRLTSVTIGNNVTSIGDYAFIRCSGLNSVTIGNSVTSIGSFAFYGCEGLTSIEIPNSVTNIDTAAFYACSALNSIEIPNSVKNIGYAAFYNCSGLTSITLPNSVTSIGEWAFQDCSSLTSVTIGNSVSSIGTGAFYGCSSLTSVTIPESVSTIGMGGTFQGCTALTEVHWNAVNCTVAPYDEENHYYSLLGTENNITSFTLGQNVETIPALLCYGLSHLASITIPSKVTHIGQYAFSNCIGLTSITLEAMTPPICSEGVFDDVDKSIPLYVPNGRVEAYKAAYGWKDFYNIQAISPTPSAIEETLQSASSSINANGDTRKVFENGQIYILLPNGTRYNLQGLEIK